jgi:hypothetical protein
MSILDEIRRADAAKRNALASLHKELGYESAQALARALLEAAGANEVGPWGVTPRPGVRANSSAAGGTKNQKTSGKGRRLPESVRDGIKKALLAGTTGTHVAAQFGVSYPTIHNIKQELGMVNSRPGTGAKTTKKKSSRKKAAKK